MEPTAPFSKKPKWIVFACVALFCAAIDLATKEIALTKLANQTPETRYDDREIEIIKGVFEYVYTLNKGVIFGQGQNLGVLFLIIAIVAVPILTIIFWRVKRPSLSLTISLAMILGGTIGNLVDRIRIGAVQDFIYVRVINFPIFNLADSCILIGTILLMSELMVFEEKKKKGTSDAQVPGPQPGQPGDAPGPAQPG
jgi:signal peptidase II